ncbi:MAG: galactose oxidase-like domain-containing protein, partial [Pseudomonadota bacterium]
MLYLKTLMRYSLYICVCLLALTQKSWSQFNYTVYDGNFRQMPDFSTLQISNSGTSDVIAADVVGQTISFALTFTRQITVDIPATFQFRTTSDDGSILYIDNQVVVNNDGLHPARTVTGQIFLNPGVYNLRVEFFQRFGGRVLEVLYRASGGNFENIPSNGQLNAGSANVSEMGSWSPVIQWPHIAISAANLPDGRILTWSSTEIDSFPANREFSHSAVFDPLDNSFITTNNNFHDMFCAGVSTLENGTIVASGGNPTDRRTSAFSPDAFSWSSFENMFDNRWYGTNITLPNNEIFSTFANGSGNRSEKYNPASDEWIRTPNASMQTILNEHNSIGNMEWYALLAVEPNGRVFHGGPTLTFHSFDPVNGTANEEFGRPTGDRARKWGNIATYDVGKIVLIGGADFRENPRTITSNVYLVDLNGPSPVISQGADMNYPRATSNTVTLPNGEVMVIGGNTTGLSFSDAQSVMPAEIYNPDTNAWHVVDSIDVPRNYHSTALLMKDGRVLSAGGGGCGSCSVNHLDGQIFSPPYLFNSNGSPATRPSLNNVPSASGAADMFTVTASADTTRFSMVRLSATTHHVNTDQRFVPVQSTSNQDGTFTLTMNANPNVLIPGYYWLYALNDDGTPSIGETIQIRRDLTRDPDDFVDSDDDGIIDTEDDFPNDPNETSDSDGDGVGDNSDAFPNDPNESQDTDGDGVGDNTDAFPNDPNESQDSDGDGFGDNIDSTPFTGSNIVALPQQPRNSTTLIVENSGGQDRIWNVNPDNNSVSVSGQNGILITEIAVGQKPWSLAKSPNSSQILVTNKADASISIIDTLTLSVINTVPLPRASQPHGIVFNSSGTQYFVVLEALARLQKFDASSHTLLGDLALDGSPRHLAMRHDDSRIFVTNFITPPMPGESTAQVALQTGAGEVFVIDPVNMLRDNIVSLGYDGRQPTESRGPGLPNYLNAPVISFDDQIAFVPSKKDNIGSGALRGGVGMTFDQTVRANTSIFDVRTESENSLRIDFDNSSLATGAALTGDNRYLFVALETSRELAVYDVVNGFELMRLPTGRAPQGVALSTDSRIAYVHNFMDRSISRFNLVEMIETSLPASNPLSSVSLVNNESLNSQVFLGKQLFYDAADNRLSRDNYMSCASCHNDGGQDGRVWDFTHLGEGLRNTIAMNGRAATGHGFQHWTANFDELQ